MHGYQLMQAIADRSGGRWTPSPGAIYPALNLLEDEGLVTVAAESGRKVATLTDAGRAHRRREPRARGRTRSPASTQTRRTRTCAACSSSCIGATRQVGRAGTAEQVAAAAEILANARRQIYLLLAEAPAPPTDDHRATTVPRRARAPSAGARGHSRGSWPDDTEGRAACRRRWNDGDVTEKLALAHMIPRPLAYVLGGGGSRGAVQLGMLQALAQTDLRPDLVVGTSVGSLNGAILASDPETRRRSSPRSGRASTASRSSPAASS